MELESGLREAVALTSSGAIGTLLVWGYQKWIRKKRLVKLRKIRSRMRGEAERHPSKDAILVYH